MKNLKEFNQTKDMKVFAQKLFEARQLAHNFHLKSKSYSEHEALGKFYDKLLSKTDELIEVYQGQYGLIEDLEFSIKPQSNILEYLESDFILSCKSANGSTKDTHLNNIIDEIIALTYKTIYKLRYLK